MVIKELWEGPSKAVVLKPVGCDPLGLEEPFTGIVYRLSCLSHVYIMIYPSSKITVMK